MMTYLHQSHAVLESLQIIVIGTDCATNRTCTVKIKEALM